MANQGIGILNRFSKLVEKHNQISGGPVSTGASYQQNKDPNVSNGPRIIVSNNERSGGVRTSVALGEGSLAKETLAVKVKPLSTFDHFVKNTSQALMRGKETPTQTNNN